MPSIDVSPNPSPDVQAATPSVMRADKPFATSLATPPAAAASAVPLCPYTMHPSGEQCLIIEFAVAKGADAADMRWANHSAHAAAARIHAAALDGITDIVPALATVGIQYRPAMWRSSSVSIPYQTLSDRLRQLLDGLSIPARAAAAIVEIPVCYAPPYGPDLTSVAQTCGLSPDEIVALHTAAPVDVMMLGFAPGHPYIGRFDSKLSPPRRATPRTKVPAGSIGLANCQSVIYPMDLPGGWSLIGRTPLTMFDPLRTPPCLLNAGDQVRFVSIDTQQFETMCKAETRA